MAANKSVGYAQAIETIEYHLLRPEVTEKDTIEGCELATTYQIPVVCVKLCYVHHAVETLRGSKAKTTTVIGYPFGDIPTSIKIAEAKLGLTEGVLELNMVANAAYLLEGKDELFQKDLEALCCLARMNGALLNVILNCQFLADNLIKKAAQYAIKMGAAWISPSTGFGENDDERYLPLIQEAIDGKSKLKTMESIEVFDDWLNRFNLGCRRISTNNLNALVKSLKLQLLSK